MPGTIDLDMLAVDMAKMLDRYSYEIDADADDIRPHLDEFVAKVRATAAQSAAQLADEPGADAATWTPPLAEPAPTAGTYQPPKYGRVRVFPVYVFAATSPTDPDVDELSITDLDKLGEAWARREATAEAAKVGGTVGRLLRKERLRQLPYAGTPKGARPW
jgi:hypothetical protein